MLNQVILSGVGLLPFATGGLAAHAASLRFGFSVDEPQAYVKFRLQCCVTNLIADELDFGLELDGVLINGGTLFRKGLDALASHDGVVFEWFQKVAQGAHVVALFTDEVAVGPGESIDTAVAPCVLSAEFVTNEAVLAHGVGSKTFHAQ
jgi:hypothetical protein